MSVIASYRYPVPSYLCDSNQQLKPHAMLHFFEDAAWRNAEELGFGYSQFYPLGRMWILSRVRIELDRYPQWQDEIELHTWPAGTEKLFALRDFEAFSGSGERYFGATTQWVLFDMKRSRPIPPAMVFDDALLDRIPTHRACSGSPIRLLPPEAGEAAGQLLAGYSAIDVNDHVNNAEFVRWGFDSVGASFERLPTVIEIDFKSAVRQNEPIEIRRDRASQGPNVGAESENAASGTGAGDAPHGRSRTVAIVATTREGVEEGDGETVSVVRFHR